MNKSMVKFCLLAICIMAIVFCVSCQSAENKSDGSESSKTGKLPQTIVSEFDKPYTGSWFKIIATDIKTVRDAPATDDRLVVGVRFEVENISDGNHRLSAGDISAYADNVAVSWSPPTAVDSGAEDLHLQTAPGKRAMGYYCMSVPANAKKLEIRVLDKPSFGNEKHVVFLFDIPPVEQGAGKLTLEKYNQIQIGMTYDEVKEIIGCEGSFLLETGEKGTEFYRVAYKWEGEGSAGATGKFTFTGEGALLSSKSHTGLE